MDDSFKYRKIKSEKPRETDMEIEVNSSQKDDDNDDHKDSYVHWRLLPENALPSKPMFMPPLIPKKRKWYKRNNHTNDNSGNDRKNYSYNHHNRNNNYKCRMKNNHMNNREGSR